jgi:hypothetical protein
MTGFGRGSIWRSQKSNDKSGLSSIRLLAAWECAVRFLLLFRPKGNSIPIGYEDGTGALQMLQLQDALEHLGIDSTKETKELRRLRGDSHNCSKMAEIQAGLLKEHWQTIRSTPDLWLLLDSREKEKQHLAQRKTAEIAWREKNYAKLIELYEAGVLVLSPEEKSRLEYARKQMRK